MPWIETCVMEERIKFIMNLQEGTYSMSELCGYHGISRKTGYKWRDRYRQGGITALCDLSRAPHNHPHEMSPQAKHSILAIKKRFPKWGARKIRARLERIHPERIEPGHPEQNGCHERMHKTLKSHTANPPVKSLGQQQRRFSKFCIEYNEYRPHEALEMRTPSEHYTGSPRIFPSRLPQVRYPGHMRVTRVQIHGDITHKGRRIFVTESLHDEYVGIEQIDDDMSLLWCCSYLLGWIDHEKWRIMPVKSQPLISAASCGDKQA